MLRLILFILVFWFLCFGFTCNNKHYELGCSCSDGVSWQESHR